MHISTEIISSYLDGELSSPWKSMVEEHIDNCDVCHQELLKSRDFDDVMKGSVLTDDEISPHQNRVMKYIENNVMTRPHPVREFIRRIPTWLRSSLCVTFVFVVVFSFTLKSDNEYIPKIDEHVTMNMDNIIPVRYTDGYTTSRTLDDYSIDEILSNLSERGYDVNISYRGGVDVNFRPNVPLPFRFGMIRMMDSLV